MDLVDYKVRVLQQRGSTGVLHGVSESSDGKSIPGERWCFGEIFRGKLEGAVIVRLQAAH
jgi:hypothetical protein